MIVVDTNIMAYLLIEGDRSRVCREVYQADPEWSVPFLWKSEFRNVLTLHIRHSGMRLDAAKNRMAAAERLVQDREFIISSTAILECTTVHAISAYDAEYVSLAEKLGVDLITTDKALIRIFPQIAITPETFVRGR